VRRVALAVVVALAVPAPPHPADAPAVRLPAEYVEPVGGYELRGETEGHGARRRRWFEQIHRTAPGTEWRAIERANGVAAIRRRTRLTREGPSSWVERGSENLAGSMYHVVYAPGADPAAGPATLYAGSALGGLWRGRDDGTEWEPLGDNLYGGAHFIAASPGDPPALTVVTESGLAHRSTDDGATWAIPEGLDPLPWAARRLVTAPDGDLWLVAAWGDWWTPEWRVMRSEDGGASFERVFALGDVAGDVAVSRTGGPEVWIAGATLRRSVDGGESFDAVGLPPGIDAVELAVHEGGRLWVAAHRDDGDAELFRSDDRGESWTELDRLPDYWGRITASTVDPGLLAYGGVDAYRSQDGGDSFERISSWTEYYEDPENRLHADMMAIDAVRVGDGERWFFGTHGGVYRSDDGLDSVTNLSGRGLRVSQYYDVSTSWRDPAVVVAGAQDQGWQHTEDADGDGRYDLVQLVSGDYGQLSTADGTHDLLFGVYPGTIAIQVGETDPVLLFLEYPEDPVISPWMPVVVADPADPASFFFLGSRLWRFRSVDGWWNPREWSDPELADGDYLSALAFSPRDPELGWAATSQGAILRTLDHGKTWSQVRGTGPLAQWLYGTAILASERSARDVYVGGSGYDGPSVLRSTDGGETWTAWADGLPPTTVYCLCEAPDGSGAIVAGTETGAWRRARDGEAWTELTGRDAPVTTYWSCESLRHEATVRFATYGRGIWDYRLSPPGVGCDPSVDADDDGAACHIDCDDADAAIFPGQADRCDGVDADCDGTSEADGDGDGRLACADCDDDDPGPCYADPPIDTDDRRCGCDTGPRPTFVAALALLAWRRRRARA
jgi:photosystem II stability/assembly factor-like uncharacterized protein